jgi:hypothetical protein
MLPFQRLQERGLYPFEDKGCRQVDADGDTKDVRCVAMQW